jgi:hypothetical protein
MPCFIWCGGALVVIIPKKDLALMGDKVIGKISKL